MKTEEFVEFELNKKILSYCAINNIDPTNFYLTFLKIELQSRMAQFDALDVNIINQLVFGNPYGNQRNIATPKQLDLMNRLQIANIKMIKEGYSFKAREKNLRMFKDLYQ
jgi:hypothetical protein